MKVKAHMRVGRQKQGAPKIAVGLKPNARPLANSSGVEIPTVMFAIELNIPDSEFRKAEQVIAELTIRESETAADVREVEQA